MGSMKKLFLLDGHALVYRAHYAFISRPLINSKGLNTSAISGFTRTVWDIINKEKPSHLAVAFDLAGPTFRHREYPEYKATREAQPEDITQALPYIEELIKAFNIPIVSVESYEADDVIGTLARQAAGEGFTVYMVTPDKDFGQLVTDQIYVYKPSKQGNGAEVLGPKEIAEHWGIERAEQVVDMLGLMGDAVDNIPGIPGVGEKTAARLLEKYGTVENLLAHKDSLEGKLRDKVCEHEDKAILSKKLATIDTHAPVRFDEKMFRIEGFDRERLRELFKLLEFRGLAETILGAGQQPVQLMLFGDPQPAAPVEEKPFKIGERDIHSTPHQYRIADTPAGIQELLQLLKKAEWISFDTETTGLDAHRVSLVGMSFCINGGEAYYVPVPAEMAEARKRIEAFRELLEDESKHFIGQNIKYDMLVLKWHGIEMPTPSFDTMLAHYLVEPDMRHKLDYLAEAYLNYKMIGIEELIGKRSASQISMRDIAVDRVAEYAAEDADITFQLRDVLQTEIEAKEVEEVFRTIELPLVRVLVDMEHAGVRVDGEFLKDYSRVLEGQIREAEQLVYLKAGVRFNISSPKQVGEVLFEKLKIPYKWRKTSTNQYSTDEEKLTELEPEYEVVRDILSYRKLTKLKSTYVDALPQMIHPQTGRVHSSFNQARAATGRLASENPNLQNIPIRDEAGREIRKAFVAGDDKRILISADYSQVELRLIAAIAKEEMMLEAFRNGQDIHSATAAKVYGIAYDEVTREQRAHAKTVNFSILYGAGPQNISRQLDIGRNEARELIDQYFKTYRGLKTYMTDVVEQARKNGYVSTLLGRKRILRDINSRNALARANAERVAINTPIQGTAADMIKLAMIHIHDAFRRKKLDAKMILQVHDELVFDAPHAKREEVCRIVVDKMKHAIPGLGVPIEVGLGYGNNWLEAH